MRTITTADLTYVWNGSHTCNIYRGVQEVDCFTFAWDKDHPSDIDFLDALKNWWADEDISA
jgi:hypothetical protein